MSERDSVDAGTKKDIHPVTTGTTEAAGEVVPKVHFSLLSALGLQFSISGTPLSIGIYLSLTIGLGGSPGYFWGFVFAGFMQILPFLCVSELASALPHSSGFAHWVILLAPERAKRFLGFAIGWLTTAAWICILTASYLYLAQITMALIAAAEPTYVLKAWHTYLVFIAYAIVTVTLNMPGLFKSQHYFLMSGIVAFNGTALFWLISLLIRASPKQSAHNVFIHFVNASGWSSNGLVFFLGMLPGIATMGSPDGAVHLVDEMDQPGKQLPKVIMGSYALSYFTGLPMIIVYEFCNVSPFSLLQPIGGQPIIQLLVNGYRSLPLTIIAVSFLIYALFVGAIAALLSASRLYWSFSREGALPFHRTMAKLSSRDQLPLNALLWTAFLGTALGAISVGSSTAMNAIIGGANILLVASLVTTLVLALWRGRSTLPDRWFNLGFLGTPIYIVTVLWQTFISIFLCLPLYLPVNAETMNYTSVVLVGFLVLGGLYYISYRSAKHITHPHPHAHGTHEDLVESTTAW